MLWTPDDTPARFTCRICEQRFITLGAYEGHVVRCARTHEEDLEHFCDWWRAEQAMPDPEWEAYNRALRQRGIDPMVQFGRRKSPKRLSES